MVEPLWRHDIPQHEGKQESPMNSYRKERGPDGSNLHVTLPDRNEQFTLAFCLNSYAVEVYENIPALRCRMALLFVEIAGECHP